jgi:hypothetical protein
MQKLGIWSQMKASSCMLGELKRNYTWWRKLIEKNPSKGFHKIMSRIWISFHFWERSIGAIKLTSWIAEKEKEVPKVNDTLASEELCHCTVYWKIDSCENGGWMVYLKIFLIVLLFNNTINHSTDEKQNLREIFVTHSSHTV